jgi:hypothetical protein
VRISTRLKILAGATILSCAVAFGIATPALAYGGNDHNICYADNHGGWSQQTSGYNQNGDYVDAPVRGPIYGWCTEWIDYWWHGVVTINWYDQNGNFVEQNQCDVNANYNFPSDYSICSS